MPEEHEDRMAFFAVTLWLLGSGFTPKNDFDCNDPSCVRNSRCHRVWTLHATVSEDSRKAPDTVAMTDSLAVYLNGLNKMFNLNFHPYGIDLYLWPDCEISLYVSIYT